MKEVRKDVVGVDSPASRANGGAGVVSRKSVALLTRAPWGQHRRRRDFHPPSRLPPFVGADWLLRADHWRCANWPIAWDRARRSAPNLSHNGPQELGIHFDRSWVLGCRGASFASDAPQQYSGGRRRLEGRDRGLSGSNQRQSRFRACFPARRVGERRRFLGRIRRFRVA